MYTNKDLTPKERVIYVRETGGERMAIIRIGNKTYGMRAIMSDYKNDEEWTKACAQIVKAVRQSTSFFEAHGKDFFDASKETQDKPYTVRNYPTEYFLHPWPSQRKR